MGTDADSYRDIVEANEIIGELLTHPVPDWQRIAALAERIQRLAASQQ